MYEARKICNLLLAEFSETTAGLTNLRLNKLLYFVHAEALRSSPHGIIRNHFEAWQYGPVIKTVFDAFKKYGETRVTEPAYYTDYSTGRIVPIPFDDVSDADKEFILFEARRYDRFSTGQLVALSHEAGGAWDIVYKEVLKNPAGSSRISNELIRASYYRPAKSTGIH